MTSWTPEAEARLRQGRIDEESFSQIARAIGNGITREACIGKAHRLGLPGGRAGRPKIKFKPIRSPKPIPQPKASPPPVARASAGFAAVNAVRSAERRASDPGLLAVVTLPREPIVCDAPEGGVDIVGLQRHHCRWIAGDAFDDARYCGAPRAGEGPYCSAHYAIAYPRPQSRTEAQAAADLRKRMAAAKQWKEQTYGREAAN